MRRFVTPALVAILAVALLGAGYPAKSKKVSVRTWARTVCTSVGAWVEGARQGSEELGQTLAQSDTDLATVRQTLAQYFSATTDSTEGVIADVKDAGYPDTPKGRLAWRALQDGFEQVRDVFAEGAALVAQLPVDDAAAFQTQLETVRSKLDAGIGEFSSAFDRLDALDPGNKLARAFKATPACRALGSS